jgi:hypothetical protein
MNPIFYAIPAVISGAILHYMVSWTNGKAPVSFMAYLLNDKKSTLHTLGGCIVAVVTIIASGSFDLSGQSIALAILAGYGVDSALNKPGLAAV